MVLDALAQRYGGRPSDYWYGDGPYNIGRYLFDFKVLEMAAQEEERQRKKAEMRSRRR